MKKTLKELRLERGLTQKDMADVLGYSYKSSYNQLELGYIKIKLEQAEKLSNYFGVDIGDIFFEDRVRKNKTLKTKSTSK